MQLVERILQAPLGSRRDDWLWQSAHVVAPPRAGATRLVQHALTARPLSTRNPAVSFCQAPSTTGHGIRRWECHITTRIWPPTADQPRKGTTMNIISRRAAVSVAALAATAFSALTVPPSQGAVAIPEPISHASPTPSPKSTRDTPIHERPCFTWRSNWNDALDAPEPTCPLTPTH